MSSVATAFAIVTILLIPSAISAYEKSPLILNTTSMHFILSKNLAFSKCICLFLRIVTGVSLTKVNGVFQFSIAQHKLQAYGSVGFVGINEAWKLASSFDLNENSTHEGVDYHTLTYENRSINLDTIVVPEGRVVTGVRFNRNDIGHLRLEVRVTEIDLRAGKLNNLEQSVWLSNVDGGKSRIKVDNMDLPTKSPKPSTPNFKENTYVRFSPSHRKVDVSQSTVPFIDTLRVEPIIHVSVPDYVDNPLYFLLNE